MEKEIHVQESEIGASPASSASKASDLSERFENDEEEGDVCRICRNPGETDNPLRYPCACSGSIKYVHQECLLQWLNHSNARQCEVCKHSFSFSPVYAENAPARLPFREFVFGMAMKACHVLRFFLRLAFVLSVWLLIIPFITFWIWRLTFVRSLGEAHRVFLSHASAPLILTDCLHGFLLSASIVFVFLGATSLRDYFRNIRELGGNDADRVDEVQERNGGRAARRLPRLEAHVERMFDGLDDADGGEDVPFDELVGMQGPMLHLIENAITVLASNAIFLGVVAFVPFTIGRLVFYYLSWFLSSTSSPMFSSVMPLTESAISFANLTFMNAFTSLKNSSEGHYDRGLVGKVVEAVTGVKNNATGLDEMSINVIESALDTSKVVNIGSSHLSNAATLATGYMFIFGVIFLYLGLVSFIRYTRGERFIFGRLYGMAYIAEAIPSLFIQFLAAMRHLMTMLKVAFLLVIELGVFPLMCGWWLDICTLRMLNTNMAQRIEFFSFSPLASSLIHWLVGIVYMLQISIFVGLLRGVLRNGVLYFLRDPADPNYNPFRDLIDDPVHKHARRVMLSVAVYGSLIVMLVFLPVKLAMRLVPSVFPLDISVSDPFTEIPADMLLFQICIPFAMEHFKPRATVKAILYRWFAAVGCVLGLTEFLLPGPDENAANENVEPARQDRLQNLRIQQEQVFEPHVNGGRHDLDVIDDSDGYDQADSEYGFVVRIVLLLVLAWMTLLLFNSAFLVLPISLGRALFNSIPRLPFTHGIKCNDLYAFNIGCYAILSLAAGARYNFEYIRARRTRALVSQILKWCSIVMKCSALLSIWIIVIPVLIGLLFELLVIVPLRVPVDESPIFLLYQDWALGLIFLKIWTRLVMMDHMAPLVDESWRLKFETVREDGFSRLRCLWVLRAIVIPILMKLLTALCVPYVFARGFFPMLGYPLVVNSAVYRFAWLGCLFLGTLCFCARRFHIWFGNLHNSIRDDRYLIGRRLHDYGESEATAQPHEDVSPRTAPLDRGFEAEIAELGVQLRRANQGLPEQQEAA